MDKNEKPQKAAVVLAIVLVLLNIVDKLLEIIIRLTDRFGA